MIYFLLSHKQQMARIKINTFVLIFALLINNIYADEEGHVHDQDADDTTPKVIYTSPRVSGFAYLAEHFDDYDKFESVWIQSEAKKDGIDEDIAKYDGVWAVESPKRNMQEGDLGLVYKSKARHGAISASLNKLFKFEDKPLIVQYEVNFQEGQECGGAYIKLLTHDSAHLDLKKFHDQTPYTVMFGPDKCGNDHKLHFIFRHKNPLNGSIEEKHCKKSKERLEDYFKDKIPHLYTLIVRPDNTYQIKVDHKIVNEGSLLDDFTPPVNPPLEIEDPNDTRPEEWDDREKIPDPTAIKPEDWDEDAPAQIVDEDDKMPDNWLEDEPPTIPNPDAVKPEDWDVEMDGDWEPPEIANPKCQDAAGCGPYKQKMMKNPRYKGKWLPALITNPNYKGKWKPRLIHNPDYYNDLHPFKMSTIYAVGFELWSMSADILFDNLIITDDEDVAKQWASDSFDINQRRIAQETASLWGRMMRSMNHKPGWWAVYFVYCSIPIAIYIWYLYRRSQEWSVWRSVVNFTGEHPWIWAVYILIVGIPVLILFYCCCFPSQDKHDASESKDLLNSHDEMNKPSDMDGLDGLDDETQQDFGGNAKDTDEIGEVDQVLESDKDENAGGGDGPRRRKPNKE